MVKKIIKKRKSDEEATLSEGWFDLEYIFRKIETLDDYLRRVGLLSMENDSNKTAEKGFLYSDTHDCYYISSSYEVIDAVSTTPELNEHYVMKEYDKIFPQYNEETDQVEDTNMGIWDHYIMLKRKMAKKDQWVTPPPGFYRFSYDTNLGDLFSPISNVLSDKYIDLPSNIKVMKDDMEKFFQSKEAYTEMNMVHKRGALVYGPPGNGKTFNIVHTCRKMIQKFDCYVILLSSKECDFEDIATTFDSLLDDKNIICVLEEVTERIGDIEPMLSFLDGEYSWDNIYTIATTNYPEKLEKNIVDRPGRFDRVLKIGEPSREACQKYLEEYLERSVSEKELDSIEGLSFSYLKEIILRSKLFDETLDKTVDNFKELKESIDECFKDETGQIGFDRL